MSLTPVPVLAVGGVDVASGPDPDGSWPGLMALDGVKVTWGRSGALEQPTPATATLGVFDPAGTWATTTDLIGQPVTVRWTVEGTSQVYFRGRIASVEVAPHTARQGPAGRVTGALVTMAATSILTDLANRRPTDPATAWPAETLAARRARIAAQVTGPVTTVATRPTWDAAPLAAVDNPGESKMLDLLTGLFVNTGADRFSYDPDTQAIDWVARRTFPADSVAHLTRDATRPGVYVTGPTVQRTASDPAEPAVSIPASSVADAGSVSRDMASRITRVTLTYPGTGKGFTVLTAGVDETVVGIRSLDVATEHTDDTQALAAANDLSALATGEATGWTLDPLVWDTTKTGRFETLEQVRLLLAGCERSGVFWLSGSWLPGYGIRPLFGIMGGSITCKRGQWLVTFTVAPTGVTGTAPGIPWEALDGSLLWDDDPTHAARLDDSVTFGDMAYVSSPTISIGA